MTDDIYVHVQVDLAVLYAAFRAWLFGKPLAIKIISEVEL